MTISYEEQKKRIQQFRPIDDTFFQVLADDVDFCQEILRVILEDDVIRESGTVIDDGLYTVRVNTKVNDGSDIAELMQCFTQTEVDNEKFPVFSNRMYYLKHSKGGSNTMCRVMEEYAREYAQEYAQELIQELINEKIKKALTEGIAPEMLVNIFDVSLEKILELQKNNMEKV